MIGVGRLGVFECEGRAWPCRCRPSGRAEGRSPVAEGLGVSPNPSNPPESPFAKGGLRGLGIKGVETGFETGFESASQMEGQHRSRESSGTVPVGVTLSEYA